MKQKRSSVLIVEDDQILCEVISDLMTEYNFPFEMANNGAEALKALNNSQFDVILSDIKMPLLSGMELLKKAKSFQQEIQVIMMTGNSDYNESDFLKEGARQILRKPFVGLELIELLNSMSPNR